MHAKFEEQTSTRTEPARLGFCLHCCTQLAQPKSKVLMFVLDAMFLLAQITKALFECFLSFLYAIFVLLAAICPRAIGYDDRYSQRRLEHDRRLAAEHNQEAADLNSMTGYTRRLEDCQRVEEINFAVKQAENGVGDPVKLKQMRNELYQFRAFEHSRTQRIIEIQNLISEQEGEVAYLTKKALEEEQCERVYEAQRLRERALDVRRDIETLHRKLTSI